MPRIEFMCLSCGHTFRLSLSPEEAEELADAECPACGSTDTSRTYDEDTDVEDEELEGDAGSEESEDEDETLGDLNLDDE
jgi:putative FmdB family regulatory protein